MAFELKVLGPTDVALGKRVHEQLRAVFSEEELDSEEEMLAELRGEHESCALVAVVAFHPLRPDQGPDTPLEQRDIGGLCLWEYFGTSQCYLFTYLWIDETLNGRGLGVQVSLKCWEVAVEARDRGIDGSG